MIIIPARLGSTRLKNKALLKIGKVPMVIRVAQTCQELSNEEVVVATDSQRIGDVCKAFAISYILTSDKHETGTDRIHEAANLLNLKDKEVIINVQGDYPFLKETDLTKLRNHKAIQSDAIITLYKKGYGKGKLDPNIVKVVSNTLGEAMYFSRAAIPHPSELLAYHEHVGLYAMTMATLKRFAGLPRADNERLENIEHIRALEHGMKIHVIETKFNYLGVNTQEELNKARKRI